MPSISTLKNQNKHVEEAISSSTVVNAAHPEMILNHPQMDAQQAASWSAMQTEENSESEIL